MAWFHLQMAYSQMRLQTNFLTYFPYFAWLNDMTYLHTSWSINTLTHTCSSSTHSCASHLHLHIHLYMWGIIFILTYTFSQPAHMLFSYHSHLHDLVIFTPSLWLNPCYILRKNSYINWLRQCELMRKVLSCNDLSHSCALAMKVICVILDLQFCVSLLCRYQSICNIWRINNHLKMSQKKIHRQMLMKQTKWYKR